MVKSVNSMDLQSTKASSVVADPAPINNTRMGMHGSLLSCSQTGQSFTTNVLMVPRKKQAKVDEACPSGWLDAMRSSSPPRRKVPKDADSTSDESEDVYQSWMAKYPSALSSFHCVTDSTRKTKLVVFLDYDGTLSPIVDNPDRAFMSDDMRSAVRNVAKCFTTAIISGRSRKKVSELVGLEELYYAGSHGMDISFPDKDSTVNEGMDANLFQPAAEFLPIINEVSRVLEDVVKDIKGSKVENQKFSVSVHYRNVDESSWPVIAQCVHDILKDYPRLRLTHGRKVLEVRPVIDWDKGKAVEFLLKSLGFDNRPDILPIYIGDDRTDEDAFQALRKRSQGHGILVSSVPKESCASFSLRDTSEVQEFLESLVKMASEDEMSQGQNPAVDDDDPV